MKDKQLLTEINRIKEIMGVRLLTEQPVTVFDNILTSLVKFTNISKGLKSKITKLISKPNISGAEFRNLVDEIKTMENVDSGLITLINKFEKSIIDKASSTKYSNHITKRLEEGATESEITNELLSNLNTVYGDFINAKILDDFKLNLSKRIDATQKKIDSLKPKPDPKPDDTDDEIPTIDPDDVPPPPKLNLLKKILIYLNKKIRDGWLPIGFLSETEINLLINRIDKNTKELLSLQKSSTNLSDLSNDKIIELEKQIFDDMGELKNYASDNYKTLMNSLNSNKNFSKKNEVYEIKRTIDRIKNEYGDFGTMAVGIPNVNLDAIVTGFRVAFNLEKSIINTGKRLLGTKLQDTFDKTFVGLSDEEVAAAKEIDKVDRTGYSLLKTLAFSSPRGWPTKISTLPNYPNTYRRLIERPGGGLNKANISYWSELFMKMVKWDFYLAVYAGINQFMNVSELLSEKYRPILEDKCTHELSEIIKKEDLSLNEIIPYFSTEENFKKSPECFKKIISEKSNKEIELYLQIAHIQATGYDTFRYSINTIATSFWDAFDIEQLKKMSPIGGPVFVLGDVINDVTDSAWKSIQTGDIKYMDEMINKAKSEANKATEDVKKVAPEIENDSISNEPIPAPKDNDTIISPEQEKKANDSDY